MSAYDGSFTLGTGEATAAFYTRVLQNTVCGVFCLSIDLLVALNEYVRNRPKDPLSPVHLRRYGDRIRLVSDTLGACGYADSTIRAYTRIIGELMLWLDGHDRGALSPAKLKAFFDHLVEKARTDAEFQPEDGSPVDCRALRYVAFHAVRTVLDRCFDLGVTRTMARPCRPDSIAPASPEAARSLYIAAKNDRERLLLTLINGVGLMPYQAASLRWDAFDPSYRCVTVAWDEDGEKKTKTFQIVNGYQNVLRECHERARAAADAAMGMKKRRKKGRCRTDEYVFPSRRKGTVNPTTVRTLQNVLGRMAGRCRLARHVTLTSLRLGGAYVPSRSEWRGEGATQSLNGTLLTADVSDPAGAMMERYNGAAAVADGTTEIAADAESSVTAASAQVPGRAGKEPLNGKDRLQRQRDPSCNGGREEASGNREPPPS